MEMDEESERFKSPLEALGRLLEKAGNDANAGELLEKLKGISGKYALLSDEEKAQVDRQIKEQIADKIIKGGLSKLANAEAISLLGNAQYYLLAGFVLFVLVIVFFGYKLFKSLRDREVKKEEKRRQKQMRKKK